MGPWRIRHLLKAYGLRAKQPGSFAPRTTDSDPTVRAATNNLIGQPAPIAPNSIWVGNNTCLPVKAAGSNYTVWLVRCSRKVAGWDVRDTILEDLVSEVLRRTLALRWPPAGLVIHSEQGSQYTATRLKDLVAKHGFQQSMSRRPNY